MLLTSSNIVKVKLKTINVCKYYLFIDPELAVPDLYENLAQAVGFLKHVFVTDIRLISLKFKLLTQSIYFDK